MRRLGPRSILRIILGLLLSVLAFATAFAMINVALFDRSTSKVYDIALPSVVASNDPAVIARGRHLVDSLGKCRQCHGESLASGEDVAHGPFGVSRGGNLTSGKHGIEYSDAELARLIKHGVKRDGRTVLYMPSHETAWWPMDDVVALISYLRTCLARRVSRERLNSACSPNSSIAWVSSNWTSHVISITSEKRRRRRLRPQPNTELTLRAFALGATANNSAAGHCRVRRPASRCPRISHLTPAASLIGHSKVSTNSSLKAFARMVSRSTHSCRSAR